MKLIASWICVAVFAISANSAPLDSRRANSPRAGQRARFVWAQERWTGDNRPYGTIRQGIDKAIASGQKTEYLLSKYERAARAAPNDAKRQFAWGYAAWQARKAFTDFDSQYRRISRPRIVLARIASPHSYDFLRLRFLLEAWAAPMQDLEVLGERLVSHSPDDYDVKYYLVQVLCRVPTHEAKQQALKYVSEFIRSNPKKVSYYLNLGDVYNFSWYRSRGKSKADGVYAVNAYQKYLKLSPANDKKRKGVENEIRYIRRRQAKWDINPSG